MRQCRELFLELNFIISSISAPHNLSTTIPREISTCYTGQCKKTYVTHDYSITVRFTAAAGVPSRPHILKWQSHESSDETDMNQTFSLMMHG